MFRRIFAAALGAGIGVGVLIAALQHVTLVPLILEAEKYEDGTLSVHEHKHGAMPAREDVGMASLLIGAFAMSGRAVDAKEGLLWGVAGFAAFALAPAFGLPPELPGSVAAELVSRQIWWIATMVATAGALALMVFVRATWTIPVGIALLVSPHLVGAPHPADGAGLAPPELAAQFAARSLGVNAVLWALLGLASGALYARFGRTGHA